jgi:glucan phosphoethanolaminetransferase (alkaline phosphatase superfamily)
MGLHKILKIVAGILSIAGIIFLVMIISKGDDAIAAATEAGESSPVDSIAYVAYATIVVILVFVLYFVLKSLFSNPATLKKTLINVGAFLGLFLIAYFVFSEGVETPMRDGKVLSEGDSKLVGAGLNMFYFLILIASGLMIFTGLQKMIKK